MTCRRARGRALFVSVLLSIATLLLPLLPSLTPRPAAARGSAPNDFYGIVGRDPWYEYNSDPVDYPNDVNQAFLENMADGMATMGAGWVRIEIHAEYDVPNGPGPIDFSKMDWYIQQLAPKYGLKVLLVLGAGTIGDLDKTYQFQHINDQPGADGLNLWGRTYLQYVKQVVDHYGDGVAAYEILNEENANMQLSTETAGSVKEVNPAIYGQLMSRIYSDNKAAHPNVQFIVGGLLYDDIIPDGHEKWLTRLYQAPAVVAFHQANGTYPWDGVGFHPYFLTASQIPAEVTKLHNTQLAHQDTSGMWITEIGKAAQPADWTSYGIMDPTPDEQAQDDFLQAVYTELRDQTPFVERVFWFKYEDFGNNGEYANWGLVRLRDSAFHYGPEAAPWPRKDAYRVYQSLAKPGASPAARIASSPDLGPRVRYFPETGHTLRDPFLGYWEEHGGLAQFGYPITEVFDVQGRPVQYFERARFEYHPEFSGTPYVVELGLLGRYVTRGRQFPAEPP
ncbi:MAG TPA: glycosyl hydrolase, partial [Thermomicrobiaceae bacterium]|nr:glycosyl hydrolase [Thermomicrobiaceae bacterium]